MRRSPAGADTPTRPGHRLSEARSVSTYTVMLEAGRVLEAGATEQVFTAATSARTRAYIATAD